MSQNSQEAVNQPQCVPTHTVLRVKRQFSQIITKHVFVVSEAADSFVFSWPVFTPTQLFSVNLHVKTNAVNQARSKYLETSQQEHHRCK